MTQLKQGQTESCPVCGDDVDVSAKWLTSQRVDRPTPKSRLTEFSDVNGMKFHRSANPKSSLLIGDRRHRAVRNSDTRESCGEDSV